MIGFGDIWRSAGGVKLKLIKSLDLALGGMIAFLLPALPERSPDGVIRRILIIRPGGIGDAVFLLSIIERLREQHNVEIDLLCERRNEGAFILARRFCRSIYCYDRWPDLWRVVRQEYDLVIDTEQWHYLSAVVAYSTKASVKAGFSTRPLRTRLFNLTAGYDVNAPELQNFTALFGLIFALDPLTFSPVFLQASRRTDLRRVALFWGGSVIERRLTVEQVRSITGGLLAQGCAVLFLGGADVVAEARQIKAQLAVSVPVQDLCGRLSLADTVEHFRDCGAFIGTDSGLLHLAAACGVPSAGIFAMGNEQKWGPQGSRDLVIAARQDPADRVVFGYTFVACPGRRLVLTAARVNEILEWAKGILK
ncbi:MAG: glycosyltransferase family 9 protein [Candidatus Omnitrophica bacterium]|nr:glycosyltransferase family 9 protein [Candidatus Omnitrophota bacterium]